MTKIVFMGLLLTKHGIGPTEEKVKAIVEASQPQSPSEVRSFLGLVSGPVPSRKNIADALSRLTKTVPGKQSQGDDEYTRGNRSLGECVR